MSMTYLEVAAGILWQGKYCLAVSRPVDKSHAGRWEFPGGKIETGEAPITALCRELREELGITVRAVHFWRQQKHIYTDKQLCVHLHFFHVTDFSGTPSAKEGQELRWCTPHAALALDFLEADLPLLQELAASGPPSSADLPAYNITTSN